jgi:hypothetical protein
MRPPVFIVGCGRSGTAFLYHTLLSAGGFAEFRTQMNVFDVLGPIYGNLSRSSVRKRVMKMWLSSMAFRCSGLDARFIENRILEDCHSAADFERIVFDEIARSQGVDRWADSTPTNVYHMPAIKRGIPDALFVHIIRDGRNVALSLDAKGWSHPLFWEKNRGVMAAGVYWKWTILKGRADAPALGKDYLEIIYEDLISKPRETLARLGAFLRHDLDYDRIQKTSIGALSNPPTSFKDEVEKGKFDPLNRWRRMLSAQELELFESLVGDMLEALGYELATPKEKLSRGFRVQRMRAVYNMLYSLKHGVRTHTTLTRYLVDYDAISIAK